MPQKRPLLTPEDTEEYVAEPQVEVELLRRRYDKWGHGKDQERMCNLESEIDRLTTVANHMREHRGH